MAGPRRKPKSAFTTALDARKVIWIDEGLEGDHTDGHVDNIAQISYGQLDRVVVYQNAGERGIPNATVLDAIAHRLGTATDAKGRTLQVVHIPSPGRVVNAHGEIAPASHMNFVIANGVVVVPVYGTATEDVRASSLASRLRRTAR